MEDSDKSSNTSTGNVNGSLGVDCITDDTSGRYSTSDSGSLSQAQTSEGRSVTSDDVHSDPHNLSSSDEHGLFTDIDKIRFADAGISDSTNSTDSTSDTETGRQCQNYGQGRNAFTHFASEWSSLLDKIEDSVEKVSKNYEGWRPETVGQQSGSNCWQYPTYDHNTPGTSRRPYQTYEHNTPGTSRRPYQAYEHNTPGTSRRPYQTYEHNTFGTSRRPYQTYEHNTPGTSRRPYQTYDHNTPGTSRRPYQIYDHNTPGTSRRPYQTYDLNTPGASRRPYQTYDRNTPGTSKRQYQLYDRNTPGTTKSYLSNMSEEQAVKWASAPEFHPAFTSRTGRAKTYAEAVDPYAPRTQTKLATGVQFCPYLHINRDEVYICPYVHGELCQICLDTILDVDDTAEKREHIKLCLRDQEKKVKTSLAIQKSKGITCNICLEPVKEKVAGEARFGLLPNCNHCFCITCIRKWRQETRFTSQITRSCPICRVESPFVCPSSFWVENPEEKQAVINNYKRALRVKPCRLFNFGKGRCPFGDKCFYLHTLPDGTKPEPTDFRRPRRINAEGLASFQEYVLWDFIAVRDDPEHYEPSMPAQYPPQSLESLSAESDTSY